jgi:hypothetical protein
MIEQWEAEARLTLLVNHAVTAESKLQRDAVWTEARQFLADMHESKEPQ